MKRTSLFAVKAAVFAAAAVSMLWVSSATAGPKLCPQIYAPVICDNGKVYPNQCYADKAHAQNCVPYGL